MIPLSNKERLSWSKGVSVGHRHPLIRFRKIIWSSKIQASPPTVTYEEAMAEDDRGLYKWLSHVVRIANITSSKQIRSILGPFRDVLYIWCPTYTGSY
jgi:hypothetical protein